MSVSALNRHTVIQSRCDKSVEVTGNATDGQQHLPSLGHIEKIFVKKGDCLAKDQPIVAINVMKMEFVIRAPFDGIVSTVCCATGNSVMKNTVLVLLNEGINNDQNVATKPVFPSF